MKKQIRLMSAVLAACTLLTAGGAPAFAADSGQEHNYTILQEITDDTDFMWFPEMEAMRFEQDGKYGLKKLDGTVVLPAVYSDIDFPFVAETNDLIITQNGRRGVVAQDGRIILAPEWKDVSLGEEYFTVLSTDNKYGFADYNGNIVIEPQYDDAGTFFRGYAPVGKDLKYSYIDADNNLLVPWQDEEVFTQDGQYFSIDDKEARNCRIIDKAGKVITDGEYLPGAWFIAGEAASVTRKSDGMEGVIDPQNRAIVPFVYDNVRTCWLGENDPTGVVFAAIAEDKVTFFNLDGNRLGNETWDKGQVCGNTVGRGILVEKDGKVGMIDITGKVIAEPIYDEITGIGQYCDLALLHLDGKTGVIDTSSGTILVEPRWQPMGIYLVPSDEDYVMVQVGDWEEALLNDKGQIVIAPDEIGNITPLGNGYLYLSEYNLTSDSPDGNTGRRWLAKLNDTIVPRDPSILDAGETVLDEKVQYLVDNGVLRGDENGELHLYDRVTRAEFVTLLSRAENWDLSGVSAGSFTDVPASHWAAQVIEKAAALGAVNGIGGGKFDPDGWVTEEQVYTILVRRAGYASQAEGDGTGRYGNYYEVADRIGLTAGETSYTYNAPANRLFACHTIYNYLHLDSVQTYAA